MRTISLPEAKPAFEWVNGRALQKVSPKRRHSLAQGAFFMALGTWAHAKGAGMVGPEWRFHVQPPGEYRRPLVPDVAFLSYARMPYEQQLKTEEPQIAPDAVVEVLSPNDRKRDVEDKVRVYLAAGTHVIFLVDPQRQEVTIIDRQGRHQLHEADMIAHDTLPSFSLCVHDLFTPPAPK